ncbi:MAG: hypothetical protein GC131_05800 [Alphaproteobacteria bacterium]|nr:hypothetical protein [Alphaproteobacteria bacterium]
MAPTEKPKTAKLRKTVETHTQAMDPVDAPTYGAALIDGLPGMKVAIVRDAKQQLISRAAMAKVFREAALENGASLTTEFSPEKVAAWFAQQDTAFAYRLFALMTYLRTGTFHTKRPSAESGYNLKFTP